jgi:hypothetical protein
MIKPNLINRTIDVVNHINDQANRKENEMQVSKKNYYIYTHFQFFFFFHIHLLTHIEK